LTKLGQEVVQQLQKPTIATGEHAGQIHPCIKSNSHIQKSKNSGLLGALSGKDDKYLKSSSSSEDEEASQKDSKIFNNWIAEAGDVEDTNISPALTIPVVQPATTNNTNNLVETAPTPNNMGITIQPATVPCITATNNQTADHPATLSISNRIPHHRSSTASR
jgi:hypothetical protein